MKSTGMVRHIDNLDRLVIPKEMRKNLEIDAKSPIEIYVEGDRIVLKKHEAEKETSGVSIVRNVDDLGRVVIPKEICKILELGPRVAVEIFIDGEKIILARYEPSCLFCREAENTVRYKGRIICRDCIADIARLSAEFDSLMSR